VQFLQLKPTKTASFAVNVKLHTVTMQVLGSKISNISKITNHKTNIFNTLKRSRRKFTATKTVFRPKMYVSALDRRSVRVVGLLNKAHSRIEDLALFLRTVHPPKRKRRRTHCFFELFTRRSDSEGARTVSPNCSLAEA
jgi:hypothetical protein